MRFGIVLPTWIYKPERALLADACFRSLLRTLGPGGQKPLLVLLIKATEYVYPIESLRDVFELVVTPQDASGLTFKGVSQPLVYGTDLAFRNGVDFAVHFNDDSLVHPDWLVHLAGLIQRRSRAIAWSVYRSAHTLIHKELRFDGPDVLVRSINGDGYTFSRSEWIAWNQRWQEHAWPDNPKDTVVTLDYRHYLERAGERWVTKISYLEHTGRDGIHCTPGIPEWAQEFAGIGEPE